MIVALFANVKKKQAFETGQKICSFFIKHGAQVVARDEEAKSFGIQPISSVNPDEINFLISLGGDGTILRLVHQYPELSVPIIGINLGHLGFMADIPLSDLNNSLDNLIKGNFTIENRVMMEGIIPTGENFFAVNEMVIHRSKNPSLIDLSIHVDGIYLNTFSADGVIISTPNGSTAYSLAAGGPILTPELEAFVITPICPHTISNRPIVLLPKQKIEIQYLSPFDPVEIAYDGIARHTMGTSEIFTVTRSDRTLKMIAFFHRDHFATLRKKLGWSGQVRYSLINHHLEED